MENENAQAKQKVAVFWFRRDLRLTDNRGLFEALQSKYAVLPIFIFDTNILTKLQHRTDKRVAFIHKTLSEIDTQLHKFGSSLLVLRNSPLGAFEELLSKFDVKEVYTNHDYEPYAIWRDQAVADFLATKQVEFKSCKDQVVFEKNEVIKADGSPYTVFTPYAKIWKRNFIENKPIFFHSEKFSDNFMKTKPLYFPTLSEIGFEKVSFDVSSTEISTKIIADYETTRNFPAIKGTSRLSVHLRFGTVSIRKLALMAEKTSETWLNELIWREFFMMILYHFPRVENESFKKKYDNIVWRNNEYEFEQWCLGKTGYPLVDAGMRELNQTGFMHNRVRMVVASFLTKHLLIDWRWGEAYFAEKLLDYDLAANNGNWQWAAGCGCDAAPYFRVFNPTEQLRKFDPKMEYVKKWVQQNELNKTKPMVEHDLARKRALETYKKGLESL